MNLVQLTQAVQELQSAQGKANTDAASFLVAEMQPLVARIAALETALAAVKAELAKATGIAA